MITTFGQRKAEAIFQQYFKQYARQNGYELPNKQLSSAHKKTTFGYLRISNSITDYAFKLHAFCAVTVRLDKIEDIIAPYANFIEERELGYDEGNFITLHAASHLFDQLYSNDWEFDLGSLVIPRTESGVRLYCDFFSMLMEKHLLPEIQSLLDINFLEKRLRQATSNYEDLKWEKPKSGIQFSKFFNLPYFHFKMLIVAKLANVPDFEEVYEKLKVMNQGFMNHGGNFSKYPDVLDQIYQLLKTL